MLMRLTIAGTRIHPIKSSGGPSFNRTKKRVEVPSNASIGRGVFIKSVTGKKYQKPRRLV